MPVGATRSTASSSRPSTSTTSTPGEASTRTPSATSATPGAYATVPPFFPSFVLFARPPKPDEYEHRLSGIRAHNRWLVDFCERYPERRAGIGQIFLNDIDDAIEDVHWIKEHGLRGGVVERMRYLGRRV